jgi:hypothetical protein
MWYAVRRASAHIIVLSSYSPFGNILFKLDFFCFCIDMSPLAARSLKSFFVYTLLLLFIRLRFLWSW